MACRIAEVHHDRKPLTLAGGPLASVATTQALEQLQRSRVPTALSLSLPEAQKSDCYLTLRFTSLHFTTSPLNLVALRPALVSQSLQLLAFTAISEQPSKQPEPATIQIQPLRWLCVRIVCRKKENSGAKSIPSVSSRSPREMPKVCLT
jgi:hypothetical protein